MSYQPASPPSGSFSPVSNNTSPAGHDAPQYEGGYESSQTDVKMASPMNLAANAEIIELAQVATTTLNYVRPVLPRITSGVGAYGDWMPEDNDPSQHIEGTYEYPPYLEPLSPYGGAISISLTNSLIRPQTNDGYLASVTLTADASGTYYIQDGTALTSGMTLKDYAGNIYQTQFTGDVLTITVNSSNSTWKPVDLSQLGLAFRPGTPDSDEDVNINTVVKITNEFGVSATLTSPVTIYVDAVADRPTYIGGAEETIFDPSGVSGFLDPEETYSEGVYTHTIKGTLPDNGDVAMLSLGTVKFSDYTDGSEEHFVLIRSEDASLEWNIDASHFGQGSYSALAAASEDLETVWLDENSNVVSEDTPDAKKYFKVLIDNTKIGDDGTVHINIPVSVGIDTTGGLHGFDVKVGAREKADSMDWTTSNIELDNGNNISIIDADAVKVNVLTFNSNISVSTGWAYESAAAAGGSGNPDADPAGAGVGAGETSFRYTGPNGQVTGSSALINIIPNLADGESLGAYVTLTYDASRGNIYGADGELLNSVSGDMAYVTIPSGWLGTGKMPLHFVPNPDSDDHGDIVISYEFSVITPGANGEAQEFTIKHDIPLVIDAVADPAHMELAPSGEVPEFDGFVLDYEATIRQDDSETQYLVIHDPSGLLQLGDLGPYLKQATLDELRGFENPDQTVGQHFADIGANDIILRVEDLSALDGQDGKVDGKVHLKIPVTVTDRDAAGEQVDVSIKTVVVESGGNNAANWDSTVDTEYDFANNIAVTEDAATVYFAQGDLAVTAGPVHEGDKPNQHLVGEEAAAPEYGTALNVQFADVHEAIRDISFTLTTADGSPVDGSVTFGYGTNYTFIPTGGSLRFSAVESDGEARYTGVQVLDASGTVVAGYAISPASTLQALNAAGNASGLRFIPSGDSDVDVQVAISARVTDVRSGDVIAKTDIPSLTIVRDAVADLADASSAIEPSASGQVAVVAGSTVTVNIAATFGDYTDGSEAQYLFVSKEYLTSIDIPAALAASLSVLDADAANAVCAQVNGPGGIPGATSSGYFVIRIEGSYLNAHNGSLNLPLAATLRTDIAKDGNEDIAIKAVSVEHEGFLTGDSVGTANAETDATNNVAVDDASTSIAWATLENIFTFTVENPAYENDQAAQHLGDDTLAGGAGIHVVPGDASEVFDTLTISYLGEDGNAASGHLVLSVGSASLDISSGTTLTFTYDATNPTHCVGASYTDEAGTHSLTVPGLTLDQLTAQGLRYVPDVSGNDSDIDVNVTFSGTTRETETNETGVFAPATVQVTVDAVADKPVGGMTDYDYAQYGQDQYGNQYAYISEGSDVSFGISTTFRDNADGSEAHYLFINAKYLVDGNFTLVDNATGQPFDGGTRIDDPAQLAALYAQLNGNPGLVPGPDDAYVALRIDPAYLAGTGGVLSLTVKGTLLDAAGLLPFGPEKTALDFDVKAVSVEHQGHETAEIVNGDNNEHTAGNNVAVTDIGAHFVWDALGGQFSAATGIAFEGDQPGQHTGDASLAGGAALIITPDDTTEVFTRMSLDYADTHGDMVLSVSNAAGNPASLVIAPETDVTFTFDPDAPSHIISVTCGGQTVSVPGLTLEQLTTQGLRYMPHNGDNDDADVSVIISANTLETTIGTTGTANLNTVIVVDSVADMPQNTSSAFTVTHGKNDTVILNETTGPDSFDLTLKATFADYQDGSEDHYLFVGAEYLSRLEGLPENITQLEGAAAANILSNAGLKGQYIVLDVSSDYLKASGGVVDITLTAHLKGASLPNEDQTLHIDIKAGAIEHQGIHTPVDETDLGAGHGQDSNAANNVSLADMGLDLRYARLDNDFAVTVVQAYEGDAPKQHIGNNSPAGGAVIDFAPTDASEVFDTLAVNYNDGEGSLYLDLPVLNAGNVRLELPAGAELAFTYRNEGAGATQCTAVTVTIDGASTTYTLSSRISLHDLMGGGRLHYIPDTGSQSDDDVTVTFSGVSRETDTGESGEYSHDVLVKVDAVADKPDAAGAVANADPDRAALEPGVSFDIAVNANFGGDLTDGSEAHYVFVSKTYLASLTIPDSQEGVTLLSDAQAGTVCSQVNGAGGISGATTGKYFVLKVEADWLNEHGGTADLHLQGELKNAASLKSLGGAEDKKLTLDIKAVAVEHQGFQTSTTEDLGDGHGFDVDKNNNVAVDDASATFTYAVVDNKFVVRATSAYEGNQPNQHLGDLATANGASITLAPQDTSEVFTELTLSYTNSHGSLTLSGTDGTTVMLNDGAKLVFNYDPAHQTECLSVDVWQSKTDTAPAATLSFAGVSGRGLSLSDLTTGHLRYVPNTGDNDDIDVPVSYSGTVLETSSGAQAAVKGSVTVIVDSVADMPVDAKAAGFVTDEVTGNHLAAQPGDTFTISLEAKFDDYQDGSEAHYILIAKSHVLNLGGLPEDVALVTNATQLNSIFNALAQTRGTGIHAGTGAAKNYYVLKVDPAHLGPDGEMSLEVTSTAGAKGTYTIEAKAVSIEHEGYKTQVGGIGGGTDHDVVATNNVAEADMSFRLVVREFVPEKVPVWVEGWAFENDRSQGDEKYHEPGNNQDRDHGVQLHIQDPGDGNVVSSITFEYAMPSNGSAVPHRIESVLDDGTPNDAVTITQTIADNKVTVTVTANDPYGSVGELRFVPGDNYDNADVDITVREIHVADPLLHTTTKGDPDWGSGVAPGSESLHVKVDAVAQAPEISDMVVDHESDNPVEAGGIVHITGKVSFEDTADGSEQHFILLEMQDGYYPDEVTLTFNGQVVTIPVTHYAAGNPPTPANYTMQQLITADDNQPHLFVKLPVDAYLAQLMGGTSLERMDDMHLDVAYQTRDWATEGTALHFAAIATEDVEQVREYDANWNIVNDELPFDKQLEKYVPGLKVTDNNTAITIATQGAYVFWDETDSDVVNFKGYVFENDRPADHRRDPAYILHRDSETSPIHIVQDYPVDSHLLPFDPVTGRDYGTGVELTIPENTFQISLTARADNEGNGDFYFLPQSVWDAYMTSPAPLTNAALAGYKVPTDSTVVTADSGKGAYTLVFIPAHEPYNGNHKENDAHGSHGDEDFRFDYEIITNKYNSSGELIGQKKYMGEDKVIRVDAVANQAEIISAETGGEEQFSLWNVPDTPTTTKFDLKVGFHDLDGTEDHYILVEMVPNFAFRCGSYYYNPGAAGSVSPVDDNAIYTHVYTDENGIQSSIRYYKIPVDSADIDPVTGNASVEVEFIRQPGMPSTAMYPSSDLLSYGALTEDNTSSRWDSNDPTSDDFINRKGADGEYSYENNTSVIIRNGVGNGADDAGQSPGWWDGSTGGGDLPGGGGYVHWENGPGSGWSGGYWPTGGGLDGKYWNPAGPAGGGGWWEEQGSGSTGGSPDESWLPAGGGAWGDLPGGGGGVGGGDVGGVGGGDRWTDDKWIASHQHGVAIEWVFENSTPLGNTQTGQYDADPMPTEIFLTGEVSNAQTLKIAIPIVGVGGLIRNTGIEEHLWRYVKDSGPYACATLLYKDGETVTGELQGDKFVFTIDAPGGELPSGKQLFMLVTPDSMGEDFQIGVQWEDANGGIISTGQVDVRVDAVAQWADFELENEGGVYGVTGEAPTQLIDVNVEAFFLDQDGSEANYVLVEKIPGVVALHENAAGAFDAVREVYLQGKTYFLIEPTEAEQHNNKVRLQFSVNEELTSPMHVRDDIVYDGMTFSGMQVNIGTMTVEGQTGGGAVGDAPANWEYTLDNNTAINIQEDALTIVISKVNATGGNSTLMALETGAPEDNLIWLDPANPDNGLNLSMDDNDILTSLIFTGASGNGSFWYVDENGAHHPLPTDVNMAEAYLAGKIYHKQDRYQDADATLEWTAELRDGLSTNSDVTVSGKLTVVVDAVAKADEIHLGFPILDTDAATLTQTLTFDDHQGNEQHYAVIAPDLYRVVGKQAQVQDGDGQWHTVAVETIFDPSGNPYYGVLLDGYLDANGSATVRFEMHELNIPGIENYPVVSGGVSIEPNAGYFADDREPNLSNNWAINTETKFAHEGIVSSENLTFTAVAITEDDAAGAPISLDGSMGANDMIRSAMLVFTSTALASMGGEGDQIATIVYAGQCFAVTLDGAGKAVSDISFGEGGFDASADFRIIWGVAHMADGALVVDSWNHHADGALELNTTFTVQNTLSGLSSTISGADPDGVDLIGRADAAQNVSGQTTAINSQPAAPGDLVGAGADDVTLTLSGEFADVDGSESHYLLLEIPAGWQVLTPADGAYLTQNGVNYYSVAVDGTAGNPSVEITLRSPDGLNSDVQLKTGAQVVESNGHTQFTQGDAVTLHMSDVSATGLDASVPPILEDAPLALTALADAALLGADANDILLSVTFTDLKGGTLVDADGNPLSGLTFTKDELASGHVLYRPAANYAGELDEQGRPLPVSLGFDALLGETNTGATAVVTGQTLSVTVIPVADAPENVGGVSDSATLGDIQTGHQAAVSVTLNASFADVDGSEEHFFIVSAPAGVAVQDGAGYTVTSLTPAELAALAAFDPDFAATGTVYKVALKNGTTSSVSVSVNLDVTTTVYNGGELAVVGGATELLADGTHDYGFTAAPAVTLPPAIGQGIGNLDPVPVESAATVDSLRQTEVSGAIAADVDPDGDTVTVSAVAGASAGVWGVDENGEQSIVTLGQYGTLYVHEDGAYHYVLNADAKGASADETFTYTVQDEYGGTGQSTITISLTTPNTPPSAAAVAAQLDSVRQTQVSDTLLFADSEGDAVNVASVNGNSTRINFGTADNPLWGFEASGRYGTIRVCEDADGQWRYAYTLDPAHRGEVRDETFTFTVRDEHGMESVSTIAVDLYNNNASPVAGTGAAALDTLRDADGVTTGNVTVSDPDGDTVTLSAVTGPKGAGTWGTDDAGVTAFVVQGDYGVLYLYQQSGGTSLSYRYVFASGVAGGIDATETFTYTVDDGFLGTAANSITIDLNNANAAPEITGDLSNELDTLRSATGQTGGVLAFHDPDYNPDQGRNDLVTLSNVTFNGTGGTSDGQGGFTLNGTYGVFHIDASGAYTYALNPESVGALGVENFIVTLTDEFNATHSETVAIDLVVHNQNPTASSGKVDMNTWRDGGEVSGSVTLHDADGDTVTVDAVTGVSTGVWGTDPDGNPAFVAQGAYGTLYVHEDGSYAYTLDEASQGASGTDAFSFTVRDGFGGSASNTIAIDLSDANAAPVFTGNLTGALEGSVEDYEGGVIRESGRIAWSDADGDPINAVTVGGVALPASGELSIEGQYGTLLMTTDGGASATWVYTMKPGLDSQGINDVDSFDIVVRDIYGAESSQALDVTLTPLSHAPECEDLNITWPKTPAGLPVSFITGDLPFSDADMGYDPNESLQLTVNNTVITSQVTAQGQYGTLTINADGSFTYTTTSINQDLLEDFTYTVTDSTGKSDEAHLYIRLSDNAPAFPNAGAQENSLSGENQTLAFDEAGHNDAPAGDVPGGDLPSGDMPGDALPDPVEIGLANVPLPYDPDALGLGMSA